MNTINLENMPASNSYGVESKLPPIEAPPTKEYSASGYTVDERGILNNFAVMPQMYVEEPITPTTEEKLQLRSQLVFAILITAAAILIALLVS
ncbi:photosystem II assembly protein Psb34 [Pseudanabaena mucicola]|uniref:Ssl1498 family light-harvesting-like protein n=1 Tax=Pseudanabaena mucicola FACHB-723 TaxID=2692860 RepID=A0ABR8A1M6_9CYAN|nr:ssl1498 family light-harvesting-like protein [Pseudanabaena mucicola]MBD2189959.1 ssl1498 family light-harvesting-like protein [Pseudanabaena mucicola FACHB-723]